MRRAIPILLVALVIPLALGITHMATATGGGLCRGEHVLHEVRTSLMEQPRRFGPRIAEFGYGDVVVAAGPAEGVPGWCVVEHEGRRGFVQAQAFTPGRILRAGQQEAGGGGERQNVQLAARGFSPEVEAQAREDNPELDYQLVDAVESSLPDPDHVVGFADEGSLDIGGAR